MRLIEEYVQRHNINKLVSPHTSNVVCTIFQEDKKPHLLLVKSWQYPAHYPSMYKLSDLSVRDNELVENPFYFVNSKHIVMKNTVYLDRVHSFVYWKNYSLFMDEFSNYMAYNNYVVASSYKEFVLELWKIFVLIEQEDLKYMVLKEEFCKSLDKDLSLEVRYTNYRMVEVDLLSFLRERWGKLLSYSKYFSPLFYNWIKNAKELLVD